MGVSRSGAMDIPALVHANQLVGNDESAAGIEVSIFPLRLRLEVDTIFACTGAQCRVLLDDRPVPAWWRVEAKAGQVLILERPTMGMRAYLAFASGLQIDKVMGSRSTDLKGGFGGHAGRGLKRGDTLLLAQKSPSHGSGTGSGIGVALTERASYWKELATGCIEVRALPAAEFEYFTKDAVTTFLGSCYEISAQANRVGYRLSGKPLLLHQSLELLSHGIVPGTVQVPPAGQPIVQMAEANTCGGYPKIATVIESDLWRLAQAPTGCLIRFQLVDVKSALNVHRVLLEKYVRLSEQLNLVKL
jgi:biotin-dependent carboxylase-like uncharacterized protein